jgi:hypothetical protein
LSHLLAVCSAAVPPTTDDAAPDIRTVPPDLVVPEISAGPLSAGQRFEVKDTVSGVPFVVCLPQDWSPTQSFPVLIELPGNGGYRNRFGDACSGMPQECSLGYGITAGVGAIWVAVPFLNGQGSGIAVTWWGDPPDYDPRPSVELLKRCVACVCDERFGGDAERVMLAGFSRGSIACNYLGLFDDEIADLWRGMICYSHYDGVHAGWPYPDADRASAASRLQRLIGIPQFICHESAAGQRNSVVATRNLLQDSDVFRQLTFCETGFRNHNDQWVLRPSAARHELRQWFRNMTSAKFE